LDEETKYYKNDFDISAKKSRNTNTKKKPKMHERHSGREREINLNFDNLNHFKVSSTPTQYSSPQINCISYP
jgi:hypothetical protein